MLIAGSVASMRWTGRHPRRRPAGWSGLGPDRRRRQRLTPPQGQPTRAAAPAGPTVPPCPPRRHPRHKAYPPTYHPDAAAANRATPTPSRRLHSRLCCWRRPARSHFRSRPRRPETPIPTWPSPEGPPPLQTSCRCRLPPRPVILPQRADFRHRNPHRPRRPGRRRGCGCRRRRRAYRLANAW